MNRNGPEFFPDKSGYVPPPNVFAPDLPFIRPGERQGPDLDENDPGIPDFVRLRSSPLALSATPHTLEDQVPPDAAFNPEATNDPSDPPKNPTGEVPEPENGKLDRVELAVEIAGTVMEVIGDIFKGDETARAAAAADVSKLEDRPVPQVAILSSPSPALQPAVATPETPPPADVTSPTKEPTPPKSEPKIPEAATEPVANGKVEATMPTSPQEPTPDIPSAPETPPEAPAEPAASPPPPVPTPEPKTVPPPQERVEKPSGPEAPVNEARTTATVPEPPKPRPIDTEVMGELQQLGSDGRWHNISDPSPPRASVPPAQEQDIVDVQVVNENPLGRAEAPDTWTSAPPTYDNSVPTAEGAEGASSYSSPPPSTMPGAPSYSAPSATIPDENFWPTSGPDTAYSPVGPGEATVGVGEPDEGEPLEYSSSGGGPRGPGMSVPRPPVNQTENSPPSTAPAPPAAEANTETTTQSSEPATRPTRTRSSRRAPSDEPYIRPVQSTRGRKVVRVRTDSRALGAAKFVPKLIFGLGAGAAISTNLRVKRKITEIKRADGLRGVFTYTAKVNGNETTVYAPSRRLAWVALKFRSRPPRTRIRTK
jgi:hypothetical protein